MLEIEFGGGTGSVVIDAVTVTPNGVVVDSTGSGESADGECTFEIRTGETYKAFGQNSIEYSSWMAVLVSVDGQTWTSGSFVCTGVLSR